MHSSGKEEIINYLSKNINIGIGKVFSNAPSTPDIYRCNHQEYDNKDIMEIFDNNAYLFIDNICEYEDEYYEGLSLYEYENNEVFALTPNEIMQIPVIDKSVCIVWLDNTLVWRQSYYKDHRRNYDFTSRERIEQQNQADLIDQLYSTSHLIYFNNEEPMRIAVILETILKYPDMLKKFEKYFK